MFFKVAPRVEKTEVFRKDWNFANRIYFTSCIMKKHCFLLWTKETAFFPYFYHQKQPFRGFVTCNFIEMELQHECSPVNLLHIFRTPFLKNTPEWMVMHYEINFYSAELFECAINFKFYLNIFIFLIINANHGDIIINRSNNS